MPVFIQHTEPSYKIGVWRVEETQDELLEMLVHKEANSIALQRFTSLHRRIEWLAVRVLLSTLLVEDKEIAYHANGKPYLVDNSASISISHTRGYVSVIVGEVAMEVGVDIEQYGERVNRVAHKFMRDDEIVSSYNGTDTWSLLLHWSAKEVMFKCMNAQEVDFREHLYIAPFAVSSKGCFFAEEFRTEKKQRFLIHYLLHEDFVLTWFAE